MQRLTEVLPGCAFDSDEPLFSVAAPQLRRVIFDVARIQRLAETVDEALLVAMEDDVDGSDPLTIVYTSGTTTAPKGTLHTHAALLDHQRNLNAVRKLSAADTLFCNSPFFWIGGLGFALLATMIAGASLVCSTADDAGRTLDLLEAEKPTITNGFVAGIMNLAAAPELPRPGPDVDATREPLSDHGPRGETGRPRAATQHARADRGGQRGADQWRRD